MNRRTYFRLERLLRWVRPGRLRRRLRHRLLEHVQASYRPRQVRHRYGHIELTVELPDPLAEFWYDCDWAPPPELALLATGRLRPGARVFDLGAHQAVVALLLAQTVGPGGFVLALEPNEHNARAAQRNCTLNGATNVHVVRGAVADKSSRLKLQEYWNGCADDQSDEWDLCEVDAWSLDDLAARFGLPDVVWVDVEGYETKMLKGATNTLVGRPDWAVEVHSGCGLERFGSSLPELLGYFPASEDQLLVRADGPDGVIIGPRPLDLNDDLLRGRFSLIALARGRTRPCQ